MPRLSSAKGKKVKGKDYAKKDEEYMKKRQKKIDRNMSSPGIAEELKKAEKKEGYSKKPRVIPQKKVRSISEKKGKVI